MILSDLMLVQRFPILPVPCCMTVAHVVAAGHWRSLLAHREDWSISLRTGNIGEVVVCVDKYFWCLYQYFWCIFWWSYQHGMVYLMVISAWYEMCFWGFRIHFYGFFLNIDLYENKYISIWRLQVPFFGSRFFRDIYVGPGPFKVGVSIIWKYGWWWYLLIMVWCIWYLVVISPSNYRKLQGIERKL